MKNNTFLSISLLTLGLIAGQAHALRMAPPEATPKVVNQMPAVTSQQNQTAMIPIIEEDELDIIEEPEIEQTTFAEKAQKFGNKLKTDAQKGWADFKGMFDGKDKKERQPSAKEIVFNRLHELYKNNKEEFDALAKKLNLTDEEREKIKKAFAKKLAKLEREAKNQPKIEEVDIVAVTANNK